MSDNFWLSDRQWAVIAPLLPMVGLLHFLTALLEMRDLPEPEQKEILS